MANNTFHFDAEKRTPWNNQIFPGNYVAHLNAYRNQGVVAIPGAVFFRGIGALVLNPDVHSVLNTDGVLEAGTYDLKVLSPDLRQDDKPRLDKPFEIPGGAKIYRIAVSAPGVREAELDPATGEYPGVATITTEGIAAPPPVVVTANDGLTQEEGRHGTKGWFNPVGIFTEPMLSIVDTASTGDLIIAAPAAPTDPAGPAGEPLPVQVTTSADLVAAQNPSAGACRKSPSAIIVEVCYFMPDAAPDEDDLHIPYGVEAGQGY